MRVKGTARNHRRAESLKPEPMEQIRLEKRVRGELSQEQKELTVLG